MSTRDTPRPALRSCSGCCVRFRAQTRRRHVVLPSPTAAGCTPPGAGLSHQTERAWATSFRHCRSSGAAPRCGRRRHIAWVVKDCFADLLADHPDLDQVVPFQHRPIGTELLREMARLFRVLHREPYDLAIDLQGLLRSGAMAVASGAPRRMGFSCGREGSTWCYTDSIDVPPHDMPVMHRYWKVVSALGGNSEIPPAKIGILPLHREWARQQLSGLPGPVLAIHPGAGWQTKRWPARHFTRIAELARQAYGAGDRTHRRPRLSGRRRGNRRGVCRAGGRPHRPDHATATRGRYGTSGCRALRG